MHVLPRQPLKILIRPADRVSDAVMSTPAVRTLRENFPESEITLLAHPGVSDVFRYSPRIDRLLEYEHNGRHKGVRGLRQLIAELRQERFDCAILLQNTFEAALIAWMADIPVRAGYISNGRGLLLTHGVFRTMETVKKHEVHAYQRLMLGLGLRHVAAEQELFIPGEQIDAVKARIHTMAEVEFGRQPLIGFNPGAALCPAKRWPTEHYAQLAQMICDDPGARILLFGTEAERTTCSEIVAQSGAAAPRMLNLAGATTLVEAMALIGECDVFVSNDSGLMHLAAALQTPLVALFGATDHIANGPRADHAVLLRKPLACSPCKKARCPEKHFRCMRLIDPDEVYATVATMLEER